MKLLLTPLFLFVFCLGVLAQADAVQQIVPGRVNSAEQQTKPYVIMISIDGFRYDYAKKYNADHLLAMSAKGVRAESMIPSYPSLTFPNHYTLVTGLYPSHHGITQNDFYAPNRKQFYGMNKKEIVKDRTWYGGSPIWTLAEQQGMLTSSFYWVASEANIKGIYQTYYYKYNTQIKIHDRIQAVVNWLSLPPEKRPHLITFYFPDVDHAAHNYGADAPETVKEIHYVDSAIYELTRAVKKTGLPVNYVVLSDHGMTNVNKEHPIPMPVIDTTKFKMAGDGILVELYANNKADIMPAYQKLKSEAKDYNVYLKDNVPAHMHYGTGDDRMNTIGDILLIPIWPKVIQIKNHKMLTGWHGFDPYVVKDMHASFFAWGPAFKNNLAIPSFPNVDVFPILTRILGIKITEKVDGTDKVADEVLVK